MMRSAVVRSTRYSDLLCRINLCDPDKTLIPIDDVRLFVTTVSRIRLFDELRVHLDRANGFRESIAW